jgi:hypothetical protein
MWARSAAILHCLLAVAIGALAAPELGDVRAAAARVCQHADPRSVMADQ